MRLLHRRKFLPLAAGATALLAMSHVAKAQTFPTRPITMIVPIAAGGAGDVLARTLVEHMKGSLGRPIIIENVPGAGGSIGGGRVARAAADGYTVGFGTGNFVLNGALYPLSYDVLKDFEPVALLPSVPAWIVGKKTLPANTLQELVAWLRANQDKASAGIINSGSQGHLCALELQNKIGARFPFATYRGGAPMLQDLVGGQIDLTCNVASNELQQVRSGNVKAFAVAAKARWFAAPEIPTADEQGVAGIYASYWYGLWAPRNTARDVIMTLNSAATRAMTDPTVRQRLAEQGMEIPPADQQSPEALRAFQQAEVEKWWPIIKAARIKGD